MKVTQSCPTLVTPMDGRVHGILQARLLEWVAFPSSRRSSQPRDQTQVFHIVGIFLTIWATREIQKYMRTTVQKIGEKNWKYNGIGPSHYIWSNILLFKCRFWWLKDCILKPRTSTKKPFQKRYYNKSTEEKKISGQKFSEKTRYVYHVNISPHMILTNYKGEETWETSS